MNNKQAILALISTIAIASLSINYQAQNYCPDDTIVLGTPNTSEEQVSTISTSQWDQNAHNLSAICRGEVTPNSTILPATCTIGQIFFDTDAAIAGNNLFGCTSTDTWTLLGDGGGGGGSLSDSFSTIDASSGTNPIADSSTDTLILSGTSPIIVTGDSSLDSITLSVTQSAGTDITSDLEEEIHASEHNQGGTDNLSGESLSSLCSFGAPLEGDGAGGIQCGIDDAGTDDQIASEVNITDSGAFFAGSVVESALQEIGPTMSDSRTPTSHASSHSEDGSDELLGENLGTACTDGQILVANTTGGMVCGNPGSASFTTLTGDYGDETITSAYDMSGGILQLPNSGTLPSTDCDNDLEKGRVYIDNDAESGQQIYICEGVAGWVLSSGASGSAGPYDPERPPDACALCEEYEGGAESLAWEDANWSTTTISVNAGAAHAIAPAAASQEVRAQVVSPLSSDWTVTTQVTPHERTTNEGSGLALLASGTVGTPTQVEFLFVRANGTVQWLTNSTWGNDFWSSRSVTANVFATTPHKICVQWRFQDSTNQISSWWSTDCVYFRQLGTALTLPGEPQKIGWGLNVEDASLSGGTTIHFWRLRTDADGLAGIVGQ